MKIEEICAIAPRPDGWRVLPDGKWIKLGNYVTLGDDVKLGDDVTLGDDETSEKLNLQAIEEYKRISAKHIFQKWVTKDRFSPYGYGLKKYEVGSIVEEPEAKISDVQCCKGLHVFRIGFRPEWAGLRNENLMKIDVEVNSEDICFAGVADMNQKLRVKKLKVLN